MSNIGRSLDALPVVDRGSREDGETGPVWSDLPAVALPRTLALSTALMPLERAIEAVGMLQARLGDGPFRDGMVRIEGTLESLVLPDMANRPGTLLQLMIADACEERPVQRDLRPAANALGALRHGLAVLRTAGRPALRADLLDELHRRLGEGAAAATAGARRPRARQGEAGPGHDRIVAPVSRSPAACSLGTSGGGDRSGQALPELERFLVDPPALPLLVRMAMVAAWIEANAVFGAYSGAVARLLMPLMAAAENRLPLFISQVLAANPDGYRDALATLRSGRDWEGWIAFFLSRISLAAATATERLQRAERLRADREAEMVSLRSDSNARRLADLAFGVPVLTAGHAQELLGVSFQTANAAVATLVRLGILTPHSSIRRNRIFIFASTVGMLTGSLDGSTAAGRRCPDRHASALDKLPA